MIYAPYKRFIESRLTIVDKTGAEVPFMLNEIQDKFCREATGKDIILKARQQGFTSLITGKNLGNFLLKENAQEVVVADNADNSMAMLERVKWYLHSYERSSQTKVPLKYNSKYELANAAMNSKFNIGTANNVEFGRSRTIRDAHLSEAAFFREFRKLLASLLQAVVPDGTVTIETTANGFNDFKTFWDDSVAGKTGFKAHFFPGSAFYSPEFLALKRKELGDRLFSQEYPETPEEAFITSGNPYFDSEAMKHYLDYVKNIQPMKEREELFL